MQRHRGQVCRRLELAREVTKQDSELDRLLHHRKVRIVSGAESAEIKHLDKLIAKLRIAEDQSVGEEQESVVEPVKVSNKKDNEPVSLKTVNPGEEEHVNKEENASALKKTVNPGEEEQVNKEENASGLIKTVKPGEEEHDNKEDNASGLIKTVKPGEEKHVTDLLSLSGEATASEGVDKNSASRPVVSRFNTLAKHLRIPKHLMDPDSSAKDKSLGSGTDKGTLLSSSEVDIDSLPNRHSRVRRSHFLRNEVVDNKLQALNTQASFDTDINDLTLKMGQWTLSECICDRKVKKTQCTACGEILDGRVFRRCKSHPRDIVYFLKDLFYCPKCEADIAELREIEEGT